MRGTGQAVRRRTEKEEVSVVARDRRHWRQQFVLLCRHVQRLQDAHARFVRRLPQLKAEYDQLESQQTRKGRR
jgi:hypothetical protein